MFVTVIVCICVSICWQAQSNMQWVSSLSRHIQSVQRYGMAGPFRGPLLGLNLNIDDAAFACHLNPHRQMRNTHTETHCQRLARCGGVVVRSVEGSYAAAGCCVHRQHCGGGRRLSRLTTTTTQEPVFRIASTTNTFDATRKIPAAATLPASSIHYDCLLRRTLTVYS